jgi:hypothetical protein
MNKAIEMIVSGIVFLIYLALPIMTIWGWIRWASRSHGASLSSILSLIGFTFGTASGILAMSSVVYSAAIGGFPFYDPLLLRIYGTGAVLSLTGILFSLGGLWRPSLLRWYAPLCSAGTLLFWFASAMGE